LLGVLVFGDEVIDGGADAVEFFRFEDAGAFREIAVGAGEVSAAHAAWEAGAEVLAIEEGRGVGEVAVEGRVALAEVAVDGFEDAKAHGGGEAEGFESLVGGGIADAGVEGHDADVIGEDDVADEGVGLGGVAKEFGRQVLGVGSIGRGFFGEEAREGVDDVAGAAEGKGLGAVDEEGAVEGFEFEFEGVAEGEEGGGEEGGGAGLAGTEGDGGINRDGHAQGMGIAHVRVKLVEGVPEGENG